MRSFNQLEIELNRQYHGSQIVISDRKSIEEHVNTFQLSEEEMKSLRCVVSVYEN